MFNRISELTKVSLLSMMLAGSPAWAQAEDSMSSGELDEMIDDLGGGQNATSESSGMNGGSAPIDSSTSTTIASAPPMDDSPREYTSTPARDLDDDNGPDEEGGVDREIGESGASEGFYSSGSGISGGTPEPIVDSPYRNMKDGPTPIPTGDKYNSDYGSKHKKKVAKKSKKPKKKMAKASKHSKKKIAKHKSKRRDVASSKAKSKKKSKDKRVASRKSSKRYR